MNYSRRRLEEAGNFGELVDFCEKGKYSVRINNRGGWVFIPPLQPFGPVEPPSTKEREGKQVKDGFPSPKLISLLHGTENWSVCYWPVKPGEYLYFVEVCRIKTLS